MPFKVDFITNSSEGNKDLSTTSNMGDLLLPLVIAKKERTSGKTKLERYAGVSFYINSNGLIATCGHIIDGIVDDEILVVKELTTNSFLEVIDIKRHPTKDFAIGKIGVKNNKCIAPFEQPVLPGQNVRAFGFTSPGKSGGEINIEGRLLKGYVVRTSPLPILPVSLSTCEVSFPSLNGFSGAPVITDGLNGKLIGMLYGNLESTIQTYGISELREKDKEISEKIYRIIEFGLIHTISDIRTFWSEIDNNQQFTTL